MRTAESYIRNRWVRVAVACFLIGFGLWAFLPYAAHRVAPAAYVNAEILRLTAPIRGRLTEALPEKGAYIREESSLTLIQNDTADTRQLAIFREELAISEAKIALARRQLVEIADADRRLAEKADAHRIAVIRAMRGEIAEAAADIRALDIERAEFARTLRRVEDLAAKGIVTRAKLDEARADADGAIARHEAAAARRQRLKAELAAAEAGIYLRDGGNDAPYSEQQRDRLMLQRQQLQATLLSEQARAAYLTGQVEVEAARVAAASVFRFDLPAGHVVWNVAASPGSAVVEGQDLLDLADCRRRFVSVEMPEREVEDIQRGDKVRVRLLGADDWVTGEVEQMRGSAAHAEDRLYAAKQEKGDARSITVDVSLPTGAMANAVARQCDIGRQAEVRFNRWERSIFSAFAGEIDAD